MPLLTPIATEEMLTSPPTKARQEIDLGEGLAIGCLALGAAAITSAKQAIELSFRRAWRAWPHTTRFPQVHAGPQRDDIWRILGASAGRKHSYLAEWVATGPELEPRVRQDWGLDEIGEQLADNTGISAEPGTTWRRRSSTRSARSTYGAPGGSTQRSVAACTTMLLRVRNGKGVKASGGRRAESARRPRATRAYGVAARPGGLRSRKTRSSRCQRAGGRAPIRTGCRRCGSAGTSTSSRRCPTCNSGSRACRPHGLAR